jgi:hypothetical protein
MRFVVSTAARICRLVVQPDFSLGVDVGPTPAAYFFSNDLKTHHDMDNSFIETNL